MYLNIWNVLIAITYSLHKRNDSLCIFEDFFYYVSIVWNWRPHRYSAISAGDKYMRVGIFRQRKWPSSYDCKTHRPKYTQVYLYKSLESSRSSDILFYNEHSSIYMLMHPTVRPIYWVIYMYILWTIMREKERWRSMRGSKKGSPPGKFQLCNF